MPNDERPLPTIAEFAEFLFRRSTNPEAAIAQRRLLTTYAQEWACYEGASAWQAISEAHRLSDEAHCTADELDAEARR